MNTVCKKIDFFFYLPVFADGDSQVLPLNGSDRSKMRIEWFCFLSLNLTSSFSNSRICTSFMIVKLKSSFRKTGLTTFGKPSSYS